MLLPRGPHGAGEEEPPPAKPTKQARERNEIKTKTAKEGEKRTHTEGKPCKFTPLATQQCEHRSLIITPKGPKLKGAL